MTIQQSYPNSRPSLNLNFALSKKLDPVVTFSRTTSGTQINRSGFIESVPYDTARFDHDPATLEPRGLLIEGSRTNFCTLSGDNYNFGSTNNVTETEVFNPDGTPAIRRVPNATNNTIHGVDDHAADIDISGQTDGVGTTTLSTSIFLRNFNNSNLGVLIGWVAVNDSAGPIYSYSLTTPNTASQSIGNPSLGSGWSNPSTKVENYGNGWYRYTATATYTKQSGYNRIAHIGEQIFSSTYQQTWTGDGVSGIYIWGRQREIGAFSTSYIPTNGAQGSRGTDNVTIEGDNFSKWFNQREGTIFADMGPYVSADTGNFGISIGSASNNYLAFPYITGGGTYSRDVYWRDPFTAETINFPNGSTAGKYAFAYKNSERFTGYFDGTLGEDTVGPWPNPSGYNSLRIGRSHFASGERQNFYLKQFTYYPSALSNAILQTLTK